MPDDIPDRVGAGSGIDRNRNQAGHRNRHIGEYPFGAVLGQDGDLVTGLEIQSEQRTRHAAAVAFCLAKCMDAHAAVDRLKKEIAVGRLFGPLHQGLVRCQKFNHKTDPSMF